MTFLIGADPEIFVRKNGVPVSAHGLVSGTKKEPLKTSLGAVQVDGMALEFNIDPTPLEDFEGFNLKIVRTIADLRELVPDYNFNISPVQEFSPEYMEKQPEEAKELGCDPDFNAYTKAANPRPDGDRPFRTGAGHVHIGWGADIPVDNEEHIGICADFIKMCDATIGMFMTCIDRDPRRRDLYGKAGAFRPKPYGVEYRTPSNVWIKNRDRRWLMHTFVKRAVQAMTGGVTIESMTGNSSEGIQEIINTGNVEAAERACNYLLRHNNADRTLMKKEIASAVKEVGR